MLSQNLPGVSIGTVEHVFGTGSLPDVILVAVDDLWRPLRGAEVVHGVVVSQKSGPRLGAGDCIQSESLFVDRHSSHQVTGHADDLISNNQQFHR